MSILMTPAYQSGTTEPLLNARIGWQNLARTAVITASSVESGSYLQAPTSDQTWQWWQATDADASAWWAARWSTPQVINYVGIAAHDISSQGGTVRVQVDQGAGWVDVADAVVTPANDAPIMILFEDIAADAVRVLITVTAAAFPRISVIHFGAVLEMPRPAKWLGHVPGILNRQFVTRPNISERGQRLGNSLIREGLSASFQFDNLDEHWVRAVFDLFMRNCMRYGYFFSWRPNQFPDEVLYGWTDQPFAPSNSQGGINRRMSVRFPMDCYNYQNVAAWEGS